MINSYKILDASGAVKNTIVADSDSIMDFVPDGGSFVAISENPEVAMALLASQARAQRNQLLAESDWTQVADAPVDQAAWATYRQALRDITDQVGFPTDIVWPVAPQSAPCT